jgi:AraC family transcriptional activator FtrA
MTDGGMALLGEADTIVVPAGAVSTSVPPRLCEALVAAHARGCRIISICSGVFVLAAAGLLNGRQATTHWRYTDQLRARFPQIEVVDDVLYVGAEGVMTSAGSAAGIDLCLHLVREDFGLDAANLVARRLVVSPIATAGRRSRLFARWLKRGRVCGWGNYLIFYIRISPLATPWHLWRQEPAWAPGRFCAVSKTPPAKPCPLAA